jgi:predicted RNA-binding protein
MAYYIDLFSPDTYEAFLKSDQMVSGFSESQKNVAARIRPGDKLICYVTKLSRWAGVLEVTGGIYFDDSPIFTESNDPFIIRFKVKPITTLQMEHAIPVSEDLIWNNLSFTSKHPKGSVAWTGFVRSSPRKISDEDGKFLESTLKQQASDLIKYEIVDQAKKKLHTSTVKTQGSKHIIVTIPENEVSANGQDTIPQSTQRDSIKIQALLAEIGERMNMKIWVPRSDRQRVIEGWKPKTSCLLETLPLNYDDATLKTIENIDVLWIKGRSIIRAFEVEHTTSIYSGILRMADLMALQPNLNIAAHIVAPIERKDKVLQEISRPVFAFLEKGPLSESCSFISYESITELSKERRLEYMTDSVLEEYAEYAEAIDS